MAVAAKLKEGRPPVEDGPYALHTWRLNVWGVTSAFREDNSGFDPWRFLRASGYTDDDMMHYSHLI